MEIFQAIILGVVEGLTEFLPISSTGHLIVAQDVLGFYDTSRLFTVVIQMGAMAAVIWYYRRDLWDLIIDFIKGKQQSRRFLYIWIIATVPAGLCGLWFDSKVESLMGTMVVGVAIIAGGVIMWGIESYYKVPVSKEQADLQNIKPKQAIVIGLYQVLALVPGVSRSGATIIGGLLAGLDRVTATAFSFYLGIPILMVAGFYKLLTDDMSQVEGGVLSVLVGTFVSFITALIAIKWLIRYVSKHDFKLFAWYRILFGTIIVLLVSIGVLAS